MRDFKLALLQRDQLQLGFAAASSDELLDLIWHLLSFSRGDRLRPGEALKHEYFKDLFGRGNLEVVVSTAGVSSYNDNEIEIDIDADAIVHADDKNKALIEKSFEFNPMALTDITANLTFTCPHCNRTFDKYDSCLQHGRGRKHSHFCNYDKDNLPSCLSGHRMLPFDRDSGYCDIKGRREVRTKRKKRNLIIASLPVAPILVISYRSLS